MRTIFLSIFIYGMSLSTFAGDGKLIGTAGLQQIEGAGGGGIVPWATLAGYDTDTEVSASAFMTDISLRDYRLSVLGASLSIYDRIEISAAQQRLELTSLGGQIRQDIVGAKVRLFGDLVYSDLPQMSVGLQYKALHDTQIAKALGAHKVDDVEAYLVATKVHLAAIAGQNVVWSLAARLTRANELGLLGFGHSDSSDYKIMFEGSAGVFLTRQLAVGIEYREKPNNLRIGEDSWHDLFVTYIPSKTFNITLAWANAGTVGGLHNQKGLYVSIGGQLW